MGWFARLLGKGDATQVAIERNSEGWGTARRQGAQVLLSPPEAQIPLTRHATQLQDGGFAVVDLETTGLSPRQHRAVQIAIVVVDQHGRVQHEWFTLINPQGPVGATHIHGIRDIDVVGAPTFDIVVPHIAKLLTGRVLVAHNATFDEAFLKFEFGRAGWGWPGAPTLCTLQESFHFLPNLDRRRLVDCCWESGIRLTDAHSALGDARATAALLASYLDPAFGIPPLPEHRSILGAAAIIAWPNGPGTGRVADPTAAKRVLTARARRVIASSRTVRTSTLLESFTLADALEDGAPEGTLSYLETLLEVLEDGQVTDDERAVLADVAELYELTDKTVDAAHRGLVRALSREALEDGVLARAEKAEIHHIGELLSVPPRDLKDLLDGAEEARLAALSVGLAPLPIGWAHGEPLRVGQRVAFTGGDGDERDNLEKRAQDGGVRVVGSVSRRTVMLVTDGSFSGTKAAAAAKLGTRLVTPRDFAFCLDYIQPTERFAVALETELSAVEPAGSQETFSSSAITTSPLEVACAPQVATPTATRESPARPTAGAVRAWARENGYDVGVRGRLAIEVWEAYEIAKPIGAASAGI